MFRTIGLGVTVFVLWLLLSGIYTPLLLALGVVSSILVTWIAYRMNLADDEGFPIQLSWRALFYWPWLIKEIFKANIDVAKIILKKNMHLQPILFRTNASQQTELGQVAYANSITLTPGTVSIAVGEGMIDVHALTSNAVDDICSGVMDTRVCQMESDSSSKSSEHQ